MKIALTALLIAFALSLSAQTYSFPNVGQPQARQIQEIADTLFACIGRGHVPPELITGQQKELTREMLEYLQNRLGKGVTSSIINCYPLEGQLYRVMIARRKADTLRQLFTFDVTLQQQRATVDLPLWYDTRNWSVKQAGTIRYYYDHDFDPKAASDFDNKNQQIAKKLGLPPETFNFYLADNYQQIMQWLGLTYDIQSAG